MSGPEPPQPPTPPAAIHRDDANQAAVDQRLADHAQTERQQRAAMESGPQRISVLLEELVYTQGRLLDLEIEHTRLLHAILEALSPSPQPDQGAQYGQP
jgi:hypothetical protein